MTEFDFIRKYVQRAPKHQDTILGVGDDAAIIRPFSGYDLHISTDILVEGRHFFSDVQPETLGARVLAVNLSDMAAMGATPRWALLSAGVPELVPEWLDDFCQSFFALADQYQVELIGGDTTKSLVKIFNVTMIGTAPSGMALKRENAQVGDDIWVSGRLGLAAFALATVLGREPRVPEDVFAICEQARVLPQPRITLGQALLPIAHAAQDISDGLVQDLSHILTASGVGARVSVDSVPTLDYIDRLSHKYQYTLAGGDDYELVFTAPKNVAEQIKSISQSLFLPITRVGEIEAECGIRLFNVSGEPVELTSSGFDHFA